MQKRNAHLMLAIMLVSIFTFCTGCGVTRFVDNMVMDDESFRSFTDPSADKDLNAEVDREMNAYRTEADAAKQYYDEKSGQAITTTQHYAYDISDNFKHFGFYVAIGSFAIGFLIRRFVRNSASIRRLGFVFEIWIPVLYVLLVYIIAAVADKV